MALCPLCGNKRCPRAHWHQYACSGSNALDQVGVLATAGTPLPAVVVSTQLEGALRNLRHLYEQMIVEGRVRNQKSAAEGLLSPAIAAIENVHREVSALRELYKAHDNARESAEKELAEVSAKYEALVASRNPT